MFDLYPAPPGGDPARARQMLAAAGYSSGLRNLTFVYGGGGESAAITQALTYALGRAGIQVSLKSASGYGSLHGNYHLGLSGWLPDYPSPNAVLEPLFASYSINGTNFSRYASPVVDRMIAQAQAMLDPVAAGRAWAAIDRRIMADSPVVPLIDGRLSFMHGSGVGDFSINEFGQDPDYLKIGIIR